MREKREGATKSKNELRRVIMSNLLGYKDLPVEILNQINGVV